MIEKNLHVFIHSVVNYFEHTDTTPQAKAQVGTPYLINSMDQVRTDYTGCINVTGVYNGFCHFTATGPLLKNLMMSLGETDTSDEMMLDAVGEVANTLSGNARESLGKDFIISVPEVVRGLPANDPEHEDHRIYAIPIRWKSHNAVLAVCLHQ